MDVLIPSHCQLHHRQGDVSPRTGQLGELVVRVMEWLAAEGLGEVAVDAEAMDVNPAGALLPEVGPAGADTAHEAQTLGGRVLGQNSPAEQLHRAEGLGQLQQVQQRINSLLV